MTLKEKTLFITGASRGIGLAIALRAAKDGANIAIAAKTEKSIKNLPGTIYTAKELIEEAGGKALALACDIRDETNIEKAIAETINKFGGIDICINNASAINLSNTENIKIKRFDLMHEVNVRATFICSKLALPWLKQAANPHILNISPPLNLNKKWFFSNCAYTIAKYGMSMCTLGMSEEFKKFGIAVNSLWPETAIATAAVQNLLGGEEMIKCSRKAEIVADAAYVILNKDSKECNGNFFIDVEILKSIGIADFSSYAIEANNPLARDFFLDEWYSLEDSTKGFALEF